MRLDMQGVPLPARVTKPVYHNGLLVAANTLINDDGIPVFGSVDSDFVEKSWKDRLCQLCGKRIAKTDWVVFPGQHGSWRFTESPLHIDCCAYSFIKCPNILRKRETYGVMFCRNYEYQMFGPPEWRDSKAHPVMKGMTHSNTVGLWMGHGEIEYAPGTYTAIGCSTCDWKNLLCMNFDEFLRWSSRQRHLPKSLRADEVMAIPLQAL